MSEVPPPHPPHRRANIVSPVNIDVGALRLPSDWQQSANDDDSNGNAAAAAAAENDDDTAATDNGGGITIAAAAAADNDDDFPSRLVCPISQEPPARGVTYMTSNQAFEYSSMYRHIAVRGNGAAWMNAFHPITREQTRRDLALSEVRDVSASDQTLMTERRRILGLPAEDSDPVNQREIETYQSTIQDIQRAVQNE